MANYSSAVQGARGRRASNAASAEVRFEWFLKKTMDKIRIPLTSRMRLTAQYLQSKIVRNISVPVLKGFGLRGGVTVFQRSVPGEFPRADTTMLMKTIFHEVKVTGDAVEGSIGTPLDYGVILETSKNRSFLVRTLNEERAVITRMLTGPIK